MWTNRGVLFASSALVRSRSLGSSIRRVWNPRFSSTKAETEAESFLSGSSASMIDEMYVKWSRDPHSVPSSWSSFFNQVEHANVPPSRAYPFVQPPRASSSWLMDGTGSHTTSPSSSADMESALQDHNRLTQLIRSYRVRGHLLSNLDPLGLDERSYHADLDYRTYGFTDADLKKKFFVGDNLGLLPSQERHSWRTLEDILKQLKASYCGTIGVEYFHISNPDQRAFIGDRIEKYSPYSIPKEKKKRIYQGLLVSESFENFLKQKYSTAKRFGLEGGESLIPAMEMLIERASEDGVEYIVIGMPHRGRLNILANIMEKPLRAIFSEFGSHDVDEAELVEGSGDVKYHLGTSTERSLVSGKKINLSLASNPSHLEAVNPVVEGKTRAKQHFLGGDRDKAMSVLIHGDAAFAGQGVVAETLAFSDLPHYSTGGTVHIIVNNQVGFTTDPRQARSSPYPSDVAKTVGAPIFHVNGDDPEAVVFAVELAMDFRQRFHKDVVIDLFCFRRHGHNEIDDPKFTQPHMYKKIDAHPGTKFLYEKSKLAEGALNEEEVRKMESAFRALLDEEFEAGKTYRKSDSDWLEKKWEGFKKLSQLGVTKETALEIDTLRDLAKRLSTVPDDMTIHRNVQKVYANRAAVATADPDAKSLDWGMGELLAYASLLREGYPVRLSGQDCERGTFSHRHAVLHDQQVRDRIHIPLDCMYPKQGKFRVTNSHLSEFAVLGFEVGYSLESPNLLAIWEAQFGDFANGAQVIIDQFIASGERKWKRQSGLMMLLPHGYDGQGPEHSSARLERFLQLSDDDIDLFRSMDVQKQLQQVNLQVVNCTTPANLFHVIRRQIHRDFRKPLIVMSPKKLLRFPRAVSSLSEVGPGTQFAAVIPETYPEQVSQPSSVERVIFCSGQVYYDLLEKREKDALKNSAIIRVEQLSPFPYQAVEEQCQLYKKAKVIWCQEEPKNAGSWFFVEPRLNRILEDSGRLCSYVGRETAAAPATGFAPLHNRERDEFLHDAFHA